jgi:hypothetical protein
LNCIILKQCIIITGHCTDEINLIKHLCDRKNDILVWFIINEHHQPVIY